MRRSLCFVAVAGAAVAALFLPVRQSLAWGPEAHRAIALIADKILQQSDAAARGKVQAVLATDKDSRLTKSDIASEATWADILRDKSQEARFATSGWHAVRLRPDSPDLSAACAGRKPLPAGYPASRGPPDNCVVDKILQFEKELQNPDTSPGERLAALQFLLNLVGDVNDPLLAIDRGDQGGYCTAVQIGAKPPVRLSTYWQTTLVGEVVGRDPAGGAARTSMRLDCPGCCLRRICRRSILPWSIRARCCSRARMSPRDAAQRAHSNSWARHGSSPNGSRRR